MKFTFPASYLLHKLRVCAPIIVTGKSTRYRHSNWVHMQRKGFFVTITALHHPHTVQVKMNCDGTGTDGECCVKIDRLIKFLASLHKDEVCTFEANDCEKVMVVAKGTTFSMKCADGSQYPTVGALDPPTEKSTYVNTEGFLKALQKTEWATTDDELRPAMQCVKLLCTNQGTIVLAATNGHYCAEYEENPCDTSGERYSCLLDKSLIASLKVFLSGSGGFSFNRTDKQAFFMLGESVICKDIKDEPRFPNYSSLMEYELLEVSVKMNRAEMIHVLKNARTMCNPSTREVTVHVFGDTAKFTVENDDEGLTFQTNIHADKFNDNWNSAHLFDIKLLSNVLAKLPGKTAQFTTHETSDKGCFFTDADQATEGEEPRFKILLMPKMLSNKNRFNIQ